MDADLQQLAGYLEGHGLRVTRNEVDDRLVAENHLNVYLTEEIVVVCGRYVTGFNYEIGERGQERACAERVACVLAIGSGAKVGCVTDRIRYAPREVGS